MAASVLKEVQAGGALLDAPDLVEAEAQEGAGQDFVDDFVADEDNPLTGVGVGHFI